MTTGFASGSILPTLVAGYLASYPCYLLAQGTLIVPQSASTQEGAGSTIYPFSIQNGHIQQFVSPASFPVLPVSSTFSINSVSFRLNVAPPTVGYPFIPTTVRIVMGTIQDQNHITTDLQSNLGTTGREVFFGKVDFSNLQTPPNGPAPFNITFQFSDSFQYNPANGSLIVDVHNLGDGGIPPLDFVQTSELGTVFGPTIPNGDFEMGGGGTPLQLGYSVPEPRALLFLFLGFPFLMWRTIIVTLKKVK